MRKKVNTPRIVPDKGENLIEYMHQILGDTDRLSLTDFGVKLVSWAIDVDKYTDDTYMFANYIRKENELEDKTNDIIRSLLTENIRDLRNYLNFIDEMKQLLQSLLKQRKSISLPSDFDAREEALLAEDKERRDDESEEVYAGRAISMYGSFVRHLQSPKKSQAMTVRVAIWFTDYYVRALDSPRFEEIFPNLSSPIERALVDFLKTRGLPEDIMELSPLESINNHISLLYGVQKGTILL